MSTDPAELDAGRALAQSLQLEPLALEGGRFRRTFTGGGISAILYMLIGSDFSAMHRLGSDEVYFHHQGAPLRLLLIEPTGAAHEVVLGPDVAAGQLPQLHVPGGWWQGSSSAGAWTLVSTVVAPEFSWDDIVLGDRQELTALAPGAAERIGQLTRDEPPR